MVNKVIMKFNINIIKTLLCGLIIVMMFPSIFADENVIAGNNFEIAEVVCEGEFQVRVRAENGTEDYILEDCNRDDNIWTCSCGANPVLVTNPLTRNQYDFFIEYYVELKREVSNIDGLTMSENETFNAVAKRNFTVNNIRVADKIIPPPLKLPPLKLNKNIIIGIIVAVFIVIFIPFIVVLVMIFSSDKTKKDSYVRDNPPNNTHVTKSANTSNIKTDDYVNELNDMLQDKK